MHRRLIRRTLIAWIACLGCGNAAGDAVVQKTIQNSIGMAFAQITLTPDDANEPVVVAALKRRLRPQGSYFLGVHEVRQADFSKVLGRNPSVFAGAGKLRDRIDGVATGELAVDSVSWHDAVLFCQALSKLPPEQSAGRRYRLPSSDEWEYAARAGSGDMWSYGNDRQQLDEYAWFGFDRCDRRTHTVGGKKANAFGLYDMYGNVWEWCRDTDPRAAAETQSRIIRGGGWMSEPSRCNSVYWQSDPAAIGDPDTGFRVVMEQQPEPPSD